MMVIGAYGRLIGGLPAEIGILSARPGAEDPSRSMTPTTHA